MALLHRHSKTRMRRSELNLLIIGPGINLEHQWNIL